MVEKSVKVQNGWILVDIMRVDSIRIRGYGYANTDTRIRICGYGYAGTDTRMRRCVGAAFEVRLEQEADIVIVIVRTLIVCELLAYKVGMRIEPY